MIATSIFSLFLFGVSGVLLDSHRRARQRLLAVDGLEDHARQFAESQFRRRMLASGTIALLAAMIGVRPLVPLRPMPITIYLLLLVSACGWVLLLALIDAVATGAYYRRLRGKHVAAEVQLARELEAARERAE
jgi:hypothetical protein